MDVLYLDCFSGISGDMFAGALLDLGGGAEELTGGLRLLGLEGYEIAIAKKASGGISATDFDVVLQNTGGHHHRAYHDIERMISESALSDAVKSLSLRIFGILAQAEGKVHGVEPGRVEFHEVGAVDSIVDIVSAAILIDRLKPGKIMSSPLTVGSGRVNTQHGLLPVPAPATAEILRKAGIPFESGTADTELVTPTGAAVVAALAQGFGPMPGTGIKTIGYGSGKKKLASPNVLRAVLCKTEEDAAADSVCVLETCVDDSTGEELGHCMDALFALGALDACYTPVFMKKNRPAYQLTVLCREPECEKLAEAVFAHTGSIGMRRRISTRIVMQREPFEVSTRYGAIRCKQCEFHGILKRKPEFESLKAAAARYGVPIREVAEEVARCLPSGDKLHK